MRDAHCRAGTVHRDDGFSKSSMYHRAGTDDDVGDTETDGMNSFSSNCAITPGGASSG